MLLLSVVFPLSFLGLTREQLLPSVLSVERPVGRRGCSLQPGRGAGVGGRRERGILPACLAPPCEAGQGRLSQGRGLIPSWPQGDPHFVGQTGEVRVVLLPGTRWLGVLAPEPGGHGTPHTPGLWWVARCPQAAGRSLGGFAAGLGAVWPAWAKAVLKWILILLHCFTVVGYSNSLPLEDAVLTPPQVCSC